MRNSDRLVTPAVVITMLVIAGLLVAGTIGSVTYLTARGLDPEPMFKLVGIAVTGLASLGTFVLQVANRATLAKTERNTAALAPGGEPVPLAEHLQTVTGAVYDVQDALPRPAVRGSYEDTVIGHRTAPAPPRS